MRAPLKSAGVIAASAAIVLTGCGGSTDTAATGSSTTAAAPQTSSAAPASSSASGVTAGTTVSPTGEPSTVGQGVTTLDEQSAAWFKTFCGSLGKIDSLQQNVDADNPAEAGQAIQQFGQEITAAGQQMGQQPPPTFEGGEQLSATAQQAFTQLGTSFSDFGTKLTAIDPNDKAALQQLGSEFEAQFGQLSQLDNIKPDPAVLKAAVQQVPECAVLNQQAGGGSAAPSS